MPEWYLLIRAAKYLGVAPWELLKQHPRWYFMALQADRAEYEGAKEADIIEHGSVNERG